MLKMESSRDFNKDPCVAVRGSRSDPRTSKLRIAHHLPLTLKVLQAFFAGGILIQNS